jgi:hypothetical protein
MDPQAQQSPVQGQPVQESPVQESPVQEQAAQVPPVEENSHNSPQSPAAKPAAITAQAAANLGDLESSDSVKGSQHRVPARGWCADRNGTSPASGYPVPDTLCNHSSTVARPVPPTMWARPEPNRRWAEGLERMTNDELVVLAASLKAQRELAGNYQNCPNKPAQDEIAPE